MSAAIIDVTRRSEWDSFLENSRPDIGFAQSTWWAEVMRIRGWSDFGVVLRDADQIFGGAIVQKKRFASGRCFYYLQQGPVLPPDAAEAEAAFESILMYIDERRENDSRTVSHLRIEPHWETRPDFVRGCREAASWLEPRDTLCIDISQTEDDILTQMKPKGRYNIKVARRNGVSIVEDLSPTGLDDFLRIYGETFDRHGLRAHPREYFSGLLDRLVAMDCGTLLFAEYQGMRLATALIICFGDTASYKYGGSVQEHRNVMAPYLLHFQAMLDAKARGHHWYDFCGIARVDDDQNDWDGFSAFKRKFGGIERNYVPALDFIYDKDAYEDYRRQS